MTFRIKSLTGIALAFCLIPANHAGAQIKLEGTWTAHFLTPGGEIASTTYEVLRIGNSLEAAMEFGGQRLALSDYRIEGGRLSFTMDAGFVMDCRLEQREKRQFRGSCVDELGNIGPAVIGPPGVSARPADLDVDEAFDVWGMTRETYEREREVARTKSKPPIIPESEPLPMRTVDLGGYGLNMVDIGSGDVTVILEAGLGDDHKIWHDVQEAVARETRVVSYDRAGLGMSEPSTEPRTPEGIAKELRQLLDAGGIRPPYVLVGHEAGGFSVRAFQRLFPDDVAGLVLVDPSHENEHETWTALDAESWEYYLARKRALFSMISDASTREFDAFTAMLKSDGPSAKEPVSNVPIIVLSGLRKTGSARWVGETAEGRKAKEELQRSLAEEMGGEFIVSVKSGSYIHLEDPDLVVKAVERILDAIEK